MVSPVQNFLIIWSSFLFKIISFKQKQNKTDYQNSAQQEAYNFMFGEKAALGGLLPENVPLIR